MSVARFHAGLELPAGLRDQLRGFRRRLWTVKSAEAVAIAVFGLFVAYLAVFVIDRLADTPGWVRLCMLAAALAAATALPIYGYRWIWRRRHLAQLARVLRHRHPNIGDQLLGVIELVEDPAEQHRSRALCEAAIGQVAHEAARHDFSVAVPHPRHKRWAWAAAAPTLIAAALLIFVPTAASNAWLRFVAPWRDTPRYTFAMVDGLPSRLVVPHGEAFSVAVRLADSSPWRPSQATARYGTQPPIVAALEDGEYRFDLPGQIDPAALAVSVGDGVHAVRVEPTLRPELTDAQAAVTLPEYLRRPETIERDVRGGTLSVVKGSTVAVRATVNRALASATVDGESADGQATGESSAATNGADIIVPAAMVEESRQLKIGWRDGDGLSPLSPFTLSVESHDDDPPTVTCQGLPRQKVVLVSEQLAFSVMAQDDFGVRQIGLQWRGEGDGEGSSAATEGERLLAAGDPARDHLDATGTFCAQALGIAPQPIDVRIYVEDYLPGRERVYSPIFTLYVLSADQHALWLTDQLNRWQRHALEVNERELQLHQTNRELRDLPVAELDEPETRKRIERQAAAERSNGGRLTRLVASGDELLSQAARNPEFGVGHLEKWAEMLQILKDISGNRMPSVADLLAQASAAPASAKPGNPSPGKPQPGGSEPGEAAPGGSNSGDLAAKPSSAQVSATTPPDSEASEPSSPAGPKAGQVRAAPAGGSPPEKPKEKQPARPPVPSIADVESTQQPADPKAPASPPPPGGGSPRLTLPKTTLMGGVKAGAQSCPTSQKLDEAIEQQADLLAEFAKVTDELNRILANLEGSTFLKRLKAASRKETGLADDLTNRATGEFGLVPQRMAEPVRGVLPQLVDRQTKLSGDVGTIIEDMGAYYERRRPTKFKTVLDEMKQLDVVGQLRQVGDDLPREPGLSIAQCEFWSDTLDRWAEDLVDPASGGT
jgi:hypothetical protein